MRKFMGMGNEMGSMYKALHHSLQASSTHVNWLGSYVVSYTATMHTALLFTTACIIQCISKLYFHKMPVCSRSSVIYTHCSVEIRLMQLCV